MFQIIILSLLNIYLTYSQICNGGDFSILNNNNDIIFNLNKDGDLNITGVLKTNDDDVLLTYTPYIGGTDWVPFTVGYSYGFYKIIKNVVFVQIHVGWNNIPNQSNTTTFVMSVPIPSGLTSTRNTGMIGYVKGINFDKMLTISNIQGDSLIYFYNIGGGGVWNYVHNSDVSTDGEIQLSISYFL